MQALLVILKWHNFQSLGKALFFMELKFCKSDVHFLHMSKKCVGGHLQLRFSVEKLVIRAHPVVVIHHMAHGKMKA